MRFLRSWLAVAAVVTTLVAVAVGGTSAVAARTGQKTTVDGTQQSSGSPPGVIPALQQWSGTSGTFQLGPQSRIIVDASSLSGEAATLRDDVAA